jgi:DNA-binding CsgD family transcriptional regulator
MESTDDSGVRISKIDLYETDERYHFKLSEILRRRHRPLLFMIDEQGELQFSSLPVEAPEVEHHLLNLALAEAKQLFERETAKEENVRQLIVEKPGERCALVILDEQLFSLRLFPFYGPIEGLMLDMYAVLVEPVVKPVADRIQYNKVKEKFGLSNRETDVLRVLMTGDTDKAIAQEMGLSVETVRAYLKTVRVKLGVHTRAAIVHQVHKMLEQEQKKRP